ncbi:MAG TPA: hypothetical protein VFA92_15375, partial [Candidatus Binatia bacterium]|nr:hypothetical protein [Candidatus Binatia bacterium]
GFVGWVAFVALTAGLLRALWRAPARDVGLLGPGMLPALLAMQIVWFPLPRRLTAPPRAVDLGRRRIPRAAQRAGRYRLLDRRNVSFSGKLSGGRD